MRPVGGGDSEGHLLQTVTTQHHLVITGCHEIIPGIGTVCYKIPFYLHGALCQASIMI